MKKASVVFATVIVSSSLMSNGFIGCTSKSSPSNLGNPSSTANPRSNPADSTHPGAVWSLKLQSKCQSVTSDQCLGGYGFTVFTDGHYQIGPSTEGTVKTGNLTSDELNSLLGEINPVINAGSLANESHDTVEANDSTSEDTVSLGQGTGDGQPIILVNSTNLAYRTQSADIAKNLLRTVKTLATKYYITPFPDACLDGAATLQTLVASMQTCTADSECAYFDSSYNVIDPVTRSFLTSDDCTLVKPLTVGSLNLVNNNRAKLLDSFAQIQNNCGARIMRADCAQTAGYAIGGAASCKQGVCQANPASNAAH